MKKSTENKLNYIGKFHYPIEIDEAIESNLHKNTIKDEDLETVEEANFYRPKSAIVIKKTQY